MQCGGFRRSPIDFMKFGFDLEHLLFWILISLFWDFDYAQAPKKGAKAPAKKRPVSTITLPTC